MSYSSNKFKDKLEEQSYVEKCVVALYKAGYKQKSISRISGISVSKVYKILVKHLGKLSQYKGKYEEPLSVDKFEQELLVMASTLGWVGAIEKEYEEMLKRGLSDSTKSVNDSQEDIIDSSKGDELINTEKMGNWLSSKVVKPLTLLQLVQLSDSIVDNICGLRELSENNERAGKVEKVTKTIKIKDMGKGEVVSVEETNVEKWKTLLKRAIFLKRRDIIVEEKITTRLISEEEYGELRRYLKDLSTVIKKKYKTLTITTIVRVDNSAENVYIVLRIYNNKLHELLDDSE